MKNIAVIGAAKIGANLGRVFSTTSLWVRAVPRCPEQTRTKLVKDSA